MCINVSIFKARVEYEVTDTSVKTYSFPFPYLRKEFIKVSILHTDNSVTALTYGVDYSIDDLTITLVTSPSVSEHLIIYRETTTDKIITWNDGSILLAKDMNTEDAQMLHLQEEQKDYLIANALATSVTDTKETIWSAQNHRVTDVSDPKEPQDAVTKHYMENVQGGFVSANTALVQEANKQASAAKASQESAKASATRADESERASLASANLAEAWATSTTSPDNIADTDSTTGKTQSSRSWALFSKSKAQEAATSETNAKIQAETATTQATNAKTSASQSASSASASATSASNAKTSETNAKTSETQADTSANAAKVSETNAAESARIATEYGGDFNMLKRNKPYSVGDIAYSPSLPSWAYLECITAGTTGDKEPDFSSVSSTGGAIADMADGNVHWRVRDTRCRYEVGDIIAKTTTPKSYEYLLPCDGSSFDTNKYPLLAKVFANGKVPNLTDGRFLEGGTSAGTSKNAGIPNVTATVINHFIDWNLHTALSVKDGAVYVSNPNNNIKTQYTNSEINNEGEYTGDVELTFDLSKGNVIYGASDTVQPKSFTVMYYVCYGG